MADFRWVPSAPAPEFLAGIDVMPGQTIATDDEDFLAAVVLEGNRGGKAFARLGDGFAGADDAPEFLAAGRVQGEKVRFVRSVFASAAADGGVALQDLHVELAVGEERAGGECPKEGKLPVILLQVARPALFAGGAVEGGDLTAAIEKNHALAIRGRGGRCEIAFIVAADAV